MIARRRVLGAVASVVLLAATVVLLADPASPTATLDSTYGDSGFRTIEFPGSTDERVADMAMDSVGRPVLLLNTSLGAGLVRLTAAGTLDTSFDGDGRALVPDVTEGSGLALLGDGPVVVGRNGSVNGDLVVARYTSTGLPDTGFGTSGSFTVAMEGTGSGGVDVAVAGTSIFTLSLDDDGTDAANPAAVVHKFASTGTSPAVSAFDGDGELVTTYRVSGVATRRPQLVVAGGRPVALVPSTVGDRLLRFNATTGADDGVLSLARSPRALLALADGRVVVAGGSGGEVALDRYTTGFVADTSFGPAGWVTHTIAGRTAPRVHAMAVQSDGRLVVVGREEAGTTSQLFVVRVTASGDLDPTGVLSLTDAFGNVGGVGIDSAGRVLVGADELVLGNYDVLTTRLTLSTTTGTTTSTTSTSSTTTTAPTQVAAGSTRVSDPSGTVPSDGNRVVASLTTPVAGAVGFTKVAPPTIANHRVIGAITVVAPQASPAAPLQLSMSIDVSTVPASVPLASLVVLRDGVAVPVCLAPTTTSVAAPDPCITSRSRSGNVVHVSIRTSRGSTWSLTRPLVDRVSAGTDTTIDTPIATARATYLPRTAGAVVVARADDFADALAGIPLAKRHDAPLLLTSSTELTDPVLEEITRVLSPGKTVYLLGAEGALAPVVASRLRSWGYAVVRYGGATRYDTAAQVATNGLGSPGTVIETTGANFADAFAAGAVAAKLNGAVLLTNGERQATATADYLSRVKPSRYAIGGPATIADRGATAIAGRDRYETAVLTARRFFTAPASLAVASGTSYTDAASAAAFAARSGMPLLLLPPTGTTLPIPLGIYLDEIATAWPTATAFGSVSSMPDAALAPLRAQLAG